MSNKMPIAEIRRIIEGLNWSRLDLGGATRDEYRKMNVRERLERRIAAVHALVIPPRFADDVADAAEAIERAEKEIAKWEAMQSAPTPARIGRQLNTPCNSTVH